MSNSTAHVAATNEDVAIWRRFSVAHHGRALAADRRDYAIMFALVGQRRPPPAV